MTNELSRIVGRERENEEEREGERMGKLSEKSWLDTNIQMKCTLRLPFHLIVYGKRNQKAYF